MKGNIDIKMIESNFHFYHFYCRNGKTVIFILEKDRGGNEKKSPNTFFPISLFR